MPITRDPAREEPSVPLHLAGWDDSLLVDLRSAHLVVELKGVSSEAARSVEVELPSQARWLVTAFASRLQEQLMKDGADALDGVDVLEIAGRLVASVPTARKSPWDALVGPFYDTAALTAWKGLSRQRLSVLRREGRLLGLRTEDNEVLHPSFQFDADGGLLPHLSEVLETLRAGIEDEWTQALWLNTPLEVWNGRTAAQILRGSTEDALSVLQMAEQDVASRRG